MRDTNDVKYEFKFDHVLILVSASVVDSFYGRPMQEPLH